MKDQQPDWADVAVKAFAREMAKDCFAGHDHYANVMRQTLSGYCVVKREVLEEAVGALDGMLQHEAVTLVDDEDKFQCDYLAEEAAKAALTKLSEILGGKQ